MDEYWKNHYRNNGVRLIVEIELSFLQFRQLLEQDSGGQLSDDEISLHCNEVERRILPPDAGSFSGIGYSVGERLKESLPLK